ncbi:DUF3343 domain-containing protein [Spirochaetota bacterium]
MKIYCIIIFNTSYHALKAEQILKELNNKFKIIPVPREFSSNCGVALRIPWDKNEKVVSLLRSKNVRIEEVHRWER